jgi:hypothetical protein
MATISNRRLFFAIILDILLAGLGHMFMHYIKRGIIILLSAIAIGIVVSLLLPSNFSLLVALFFWLWEIYDLIQLSQKERLSLTKPESHKLTDKVQNHQNHCVRCGNNNPAGSSFCNMCGFALR